MGMLVYGPVFAPPGASDVSPAMLRAVRERIGGEPVFAGGMTQLWRMMGTAVAIGFAYYLSARLGLALLAMPESVAVFWPASGVGAGLLIALGPGARIPVAVGVMVATIVANLMADRNVWTAFIFAFCNAGEALLAAHLIKRWFGPAFQLDGLRRVLGLLLAAGPALPSQRSALPWQSNCPACQRRQS